MHMVGHAAHPLGKPTESVNGAAKVFVQAIDDLPMNEGLAVFGAEDHMLVQTEMGRRHGDWF